LHNHVFGHVYQLNPDISADKALQIYYVEMCRGKDHPTGNTTLGSLSLNKIMASMWQLWPWQLKQAALLSQKDCAMLHVSYLIQ